MAVKSDRQVIFGWSMYDRANSAYATTIAAVLPAYFAAVVVPDEGYSLFGRLYDGQTLWGYLVSVISLGIFLVTPCWGPWPTFSGPLVFALVSDLTGSAWYAILSLIFFFLVGGALLMAVDVDEARPSRLRWDFEGAEVDVVS